MDYPSYLIHYGTLGQKWGVRKYQNEDGTWTEEGLRRRRKENFKELKRVRIHMRQGKKPQNLLKAFLKNMKKHLIKK